MFLEWNISLGLKWNFTNNWNCTYVLINIEGKKKKLKMFYSLINNYYKYVFLLKIIIVFLNDMFT